MNLKDSEKIRDEKNYRSTGVKKDSNEREIKRGSQLWMSDKQQPNKANIANKSWPYYNIWTKFVLIVVIKSYLLRTGWNWFGKSLFGFILST